MGEIINLTGEKSYLVAWVTVVNQNRAEKRATLVDKYHVFDDSVTVTNYNQALSYYQRLLQRPNIYSACLSEIIQSSEHY